MNKLSSIAFMIPSIALLSWLDHYRRNPKEKDNGTAVMMADCNWPANLQGQFWSFLERFLLELKNSPHQTLMISISNADKQSSSLDLLHKMVLLCNNFTDDNLIRLDQLLQTVRFHSTIEPLWFLSQPIPLFVLQDLPNYMTAKLQNWHQIIGLPLGAIIIIIIIIATAIVMIKKIWIKGCPKQKPPTCNGTTAKTSIIPVEETYTSRIHSNSEVYHDARTIEQPYYHLFDQENTADQLDHGGRRKRHLSADNCSIVSSVSTRSSSIANHSLTIGASSSLMRKLPYSVLAATPCTFGTINEDLISLNSSTDRLSLISLSIDQENEEEID